MSKDQAGVGEVKNWKLEKRDERGELFEVVEGGDAKPTRVTFRRPGEPASSYSSLPYEGTNHES